MSLQQGLKFWGGAQKTQWPSLWHQRGLIISHSFTHHRSSHQIRQITPFNKAYQGACRLSKEIAIYSVSVSVNVKYLHASLSIMLVYYNYLVGHRRSRPLMVATIFCWNKAGCRWRLWQFWCHRWSEIISLICRTFRQSHRLTAIAIDELKL